jgi:exodeoxyribonuclease VII large subunit
VEPQVVSVTQLTLRIDAALKGFGRVSVEGEVSRPKNAASGHVFFTLKDEGATLDCKVWRAQVPRALRTPLAEGMRVVAHGALDVYPPYGKHSLVVDLVEERGIGALLAELERLKARLAAEGLFGRKRPLPRLPRRIGVVTSRDADAWRDFLRTRTLRWPLYPVVLSHSRVQGKAAAQELAAAVRRLDAHGVDVIVVCRGGGALEDLWCFNEEVVARALFEASVPVVTGVGHETDTTLVDLVADHRAHTPTDAAQTVIPARAELLAALERQEGYLDEVIARQLDRRAERLERLGRARVLARPAELFAMVQRRVDDAARRLGSAAALAASTRARLLDRAATRLAREAPHTRLERAARRLDEAGRRLAHGVERTLVARARRLEPLARALEAISPLAVLERGYSLTRRADGRLVRDAHELAVGDLIETVFHRGAAHARVEDVDAGSGTRGPDARGTAE